MNNWAIQELLLVDLAKTQYKPDDEGLYFCAKDDQHRYRGYYTVVRRYMNIIVEW